MRFEFESGAPRSSLGTDLAGGALLPSEGSPISDERFQSAIIVGLAGSLARRIGKSLRFELQRGTRTA